MTTPRHPSHAALLAAFIIASGIIGHAEPPRQRTSLLPEEPGALSLEGLLPKPIVLKAPQEAPIYYHATCDRALGLIPPGTLVTLVGMTDTAWRVRGRARHGDVVGWMRHGHLVSADPNLAANMKKLFERQRQVQALIDAHDVALGMTVAEVQASLGKPERRTSKLTAAGREDKLEYIVYDRIPQSAIGRDSFGRIVQSIVYVKVETGSLSIAFKNGAVESIEETKGAPLKGAPVKIVPGPIFLP